MREIKGERGRGEKQMIKRLENWRFGYPPPPAEDRE
jgi:hypothetical protein